MTFWDKRFVPNYESLWLPSHITINPLIKPLIDSHLCDYFGDPGIHTSHRDKRKIQYRFYPTAIQIAFFNKCFGIVRFIHNNYPNPPKNEWIDGIPKSVVKLASVDASKKTPRVLLKKKDFKQSFKFAKNIFTLKNGYPRVFPKKLGNDNSFLRMRKRDVLKLQNHYQNSLKNIEISKINNRWYLRLTVKNADNTKSTNVFPFQSVYLDPGVRSFQTFYSPEGVCGKFGGLVDLRLQKLSKKHDSFEHISKTKRRRRKMLHKMSNMIADLHCKVVNYLCSNFSQIYLPKFEVHRLKKNYKTTKNMLQYSHKVFNKRLIEQAIARGVIITHVGEEFTTKTCGVCGNINLMDGKKIMECDTCNAIIDRDYNAARNICLLSLTQLLNQQQYPDYGANSLMMV